MMERYYHDKNCIYSHRWRKEYADGTATVDAGGLICVCPEGINAEVVAKKLNLGDLAIHENKPVRQFKATT